MTKLPFPLVLLIAATGSATISSASAVPAALQTFYNGVKNGGCRSYVGNKSNLNDGQGKSGFGYCADTAGVIYLTGKKSLGDMDVDCDGAQNCGGLSGDWQGATSFDNILKKDYGLKTLNAEIHTFSVLGTCSLNLDRTLSPLAFVAVVCNNQLHYSFWGDTNGCDDDNYTGEAAISLAQLCFPDEGLNGNNGHGEHDVLYLAFTGKDAVPGPGDANWHARSKEEFEGSLKGFGDRVIAKYFGGGSGGGGGGGGGGGNNQCSWIGHCEGSNCKTHDDCSDDLACKGGKCSKP